MQGSYPTGIGIGQAKCMVNLGGIVPQSFFEQANRIDRFQHGIVFASLELPRVDFTTIKDDPVDQSVVVSCMTIAAFVANFSDGRSWDSIAIDWLKIQSAEPREVDDCLADC